MNVLSGDFFIEVNSRPIKINGYSEKFHVHRHIGKYDNQFMCISHVNTGMKISQGLSSQKALESAIEKLSLQNMDDEKFTAMMKEYSKKYDAKNCFIDGKKVECIDLQEYWKRNS